MKKIILLCAIYFLGCAAYAQVTIGSNNEPVKGSLLDLKENEPDAANTTATKGLLLPRVKLTETDKLYPMFSGPYDAAEDIAHAGLTVYNLGECDGKFARGVYNWTGAKWVQLTKNPVLTGTPTITFITPTLPANDTIEIPSGQDLRPAWTAAYAPRIALTEADSVIAKWEDYPYGGLSFQSHPMTPAMPGTWGPTSLISDISIWPDAMTAAEAASSFFIPRISTLTITASPSRSPCPDTLSVTQTITLNQTYYGIVLRDPTSSDPPVTITLRDTDEHSLITDSNVRWQAADASPQGGTVPLDTILASYTGTPQGNEISSPPYYYSNTFNYTSANPGNNKYETAQVTFSDMGGRAKPVTITLIQCLGLENQAGVLVATPAQTSGTDVWGTSVVRHEAKPNPDYVSETVTPGEPENIYEEFYSADFGDAGRWMNTNLTAWAYDSNSGVTVSLPAGVDASFSNTDPRWCYPKLDAAITPGEPAPSTWKSQYGLLYNWSAATGEQNTTSGVDQGQVAGNSPGQDEVETVYDKIQGICPDGWHVPSDREWNALEKEIYNNPAAYSTYSAAELPFKSTYNPGIGVGSDGTPQPGWRSEWETGAVTNDPPSVIGGSGIWGRGVESDVSNNQNHIGHAQAMIDMCNLEASHENAERHGRSKPVTQGGFAVYVMGEVSSNGVTSQYNYHVSFWTSSLHDDISPYSRGLGLGSFGVTRQSSLNSRRFFKIVRCKKD